MRSSEPSLSSAQPRTIAKRRSSYWSRKVRYFYHRLGRLEGSSEAIARGLAAGVFSGWFPWFGVQIVIAIAIATAIRGNKIVAAASTWVSNPFTYVPIYAFNFQVGCWLLNANMGTEDFAAITSWNDAMALGQDLVGVLLFGCFVAGLGVAALSYGIGLWVLKLVRQRRLKRRGRTSLL